MAYAGKELGEVATRQVGTSDAETEQGIACEDHLFGMEDIGHAPRAMTWDIAAFDSALAQGQLVAVDNEMGVEVVHTVDIEAQHCSIAASGAKQADAVVMGGDGQMILCGYLSESADMVGVGMGE